MLLLGKIPFFREFADLEKEQLLKHASFYVAKENEKIIEQSTLDHDFYILLSGNAVVQLEGVPGDVAKVGPGDFFGEMSFILNTPRSSHIVAKGLCIVLQVSRRLLGQLGAPIREKFKDQIILKLARLVVEANKRDAA